MTSKEIEEALAKINVAAKTYTYEQSKRKIRLYINGGFDGLEVIYYNYIREQKIPHNEIQPFENFILKNDPTELFLDNIFFEVDNPYLTNIGAYVYSLCSLVDEDSKKSLESKKVEINGVVKRLESEILKSARGTIQENPKLYQILKKIEHYYQVVYSNILEDFSPYLVDRPSSNLVSKPITEIIAPKKTLAFKLGLLFYKGEIKPLKGRGFEYNGKLYTSGNSLANELEFILEAKPSSIKIYLNQTLAGSKDDKDVLNSERIKNEVIDYCLIHNIDVIPELNS